MRHLLWRLMADASRLLNRVLGGRGGKSLCWSIAMRWGYDCAFCKLVGKILRQPTHCLEELTASEIIELAKRRK